jgi:flagellar biosynthetic protein FliR
MNNISENPVVWIGYFVLMTLRILAIFTVSPVFGQKNIPSVAKTALSILLAYVLINIYPPDYNTNYDNMVQFIVVCVKELSLGLIIGIITTVFFSIVNTAGQIIDMQIGFSFSQVFEVHGNSQVPLTGSFLQIIFLICFFMADGHHLLIRLISTTFKAIPTGQALIRPQIVLTFTEIFILSFTLAIRIAMPVLLASLLTEVMLGILMRAVPQMNFFVIGFPIKIIMGLITLIIFIPVFVNGSYSIFEIMTDSMNKIFEGMVPQ